MQHACITAATLQPPALTATSIVEACRKRKEGFDYAQNKCQLLNRGPKGNRVAAQSKSCRGHQHHHHDPGFAIRYQLAAHPMSHSCACACRHKTSYPLSSPPGGWANPNRHPGTILGRQATHLPFTIQEYESSSHSPSLRCPSRAPEQLPAGFEG